MQNENTTNSDINQQDDLIEQAFSIAAPVWSAIAEWGKQTGKLSMVERMRAMGYADKRRSLIKLKTTEMAEKAIELEQKQEIWDFPCKHIDFPFHILK